MFAFGYFSRFLAMESASLDGPGEVYSKLSLSDIVPVRLADQCLSQ